jgi:F0F1-type ATP synthase membrane subunit c/vacuolar-type H+-ATPase subunit K
VGIGVGLIGAKAMETLVKPEASGKLFQLIVAMGF